MARLNFPWGTAPTHIIPLPPGVVDATTAREYREARERLMAEAAVEEYMADLHGCGAGDLHEVGG